MPTDSHIASALDSVFSSPTPDAEEPNTNINNALDSVLGAPSDRPKTTSALMSASGVDPDEEVKRRDLAQQLGKPVGLLPPTAQAQQALRDRQNTEAVAKAPKLATWLEKPENAAVSVDDIPHLAKVESAVGTLRNPPANASSIWASLKNDFTETFIGAAAGLHSAKYLRDVEKARDESGLTNAQLYLKPGDPARVAAEAKFAQMSKGAQQNLDIAKGVYRDTEANKQAARPEFETNLGESTYDAFSGLAQSAPPILAAIGGTVAAGPAGGLAATTALSFAQAQATSVGRYVERGATFKEAMVGSGLEGAAEAGFALLPMGYVVGKLGGKTGLGSFIVNTMLREVPSEMATFVVQSAIDTAIANPNKTWDDWREELPEGLKQTVYQAMLGSILMSSPHAAVRLLGKKTEDARNAEQNQVALENIDALAQQSSLRERSKADFQSFIETLQNDAEVTDAFIDAKTMAEVLQTPQGQELARVMPGITQQVQEALATSTDVRMPIAQYATHVSGSELSAQLLPATKLQADGLTYAQAQNHYDTLAEQLKEQAANIDSMRVLTREEFDAKQQAEIAAEQAQPAAPKDRRAYAPDGARVDRRQDPERRKTIDETLAAMATPEDREAYLRKELFTDKMTGLGNRRAYEEAQPAPLQLSIDADSLKWINDNMSPDSGDAMLTAIGQALKQLELDAYHISGDEFMVQGDNEQDLRAAMDLAQEALKNATIVVERPDGTIVEKKGVDITYGIGKDKAEADYKLKQEKVNREAAGLRAGRGQEPTGISRRAAEREQDNGGDTAGAEAPGQATESGQNPAGETTGAKTPRQTYEEYLAQHPNQDALFEASVNEVEKTLREQIVTSKRFRPEISEAYLKPLSSWYAVHAKMLGIKPTDLYTRYPLKVVEQLSPNSYSQRDESLDLEGLPSKVVADGKEMEFHAHEPARNVAREYMAAAGLPYLPVSRYVKVDQERAKRIAAEFDKMEHKPNDPEVKAAYDALAKETLAQWEFVKKSGLKVEFIEGADPYGNPRHVIRDIVDNNHMWVFPTDAGFGGKEVSAVDIAGNPLLAVVPGETISGKPVRVNDIFRIVHDYFGHVKEGVGFRADGEENAWRIHSSMFSDLARKALTTETRGQNSWLNFGPYGDKNRTAKPEDTQFAPQKTGLLPDWVVNEGVRDGVTVRGVHFAKAKMSALDGRKYGTGIKGAEAKRLAETDDARLKQRTAFYVDEGNGVFPEGGLGRERHEATLMGMYDAKKNPLKLPTKDANAFEAAVLDAGFKGYYVRAGFGRQGVAVVLGEHSHNIKVDHVTPTQGGYAQKELPTELDVNGVMRPATNSADRPIHPTAEGLPPYQDDRGAFNPSNLTITLLRGADLSTFINKSGHFFLEAMADMATRPDAPLAVQKDFDTVLAWFGIKDRETWTTMTLEEKRQYYKQWAESYERWNLEGKAPTAELRPIMARFRAFMLRVYKSVEEFIRRNPESAKLNDDIRTVFGRMLAAENAVSTADQDHGYSDVAAAIAKAVPQMAQELTELNNAAHESAVDYVSKKGVADVKWLSKAKNKYLREMQKEANAKRDAIREEVTQEVLAEPVHAARAALSGKDSELKLHTGVLHELMPDLDVSVLRGMTSTANGTHPDQVADTFGYKSTAELINALVNAEPTKDKIEGLTDQHMLERHGELIDKRAIEHAASLALHNEARARFMASGLRALSKAQLPASQLAKAAKEAAETLIAGKKIRDVKPSVYEVAERKANRDVVKNIADPIVAADAQKAALLNNRLVKSAQDALAEVDQGIARMHRLERKAAQDNMRGDFLVQLNNLLDRFDLRTSVTLKTIDANAQTLKDWLEAYASSISAVMPDLPAWILNEGYKKHYKDLTVEEFRGLMDTVKGLELLARREEKQYQAIRDMSFKAERDAVLARIRAFNPGVFTDAGEPKGLAHKFVRGIKDKVDVAEDKLFGEFINAETMVNILEGGQYGQVHESLIGRVSKRLDWKAEKLGGLFKEMKHLFKNYSAKERYDFSRKEFGKIGNDPVTRENVVIITLLHGNKEGRERLANYGWSIAEQQKVIELLQDKDKELVEGIWRMFDHDLWPQLKELNERTRGKSPPKVAAVPFTVGGKQWTGGYFRLKYDSHLDPKVQRIEAGDDIKALFGGTLGMGAKTAQGSSTERKDDVQLRPRLDLGVFAEAVSETVHDLALREAVADTMRLLNDKGIQHALYNASGEYAYLALTQRIRDVAARPRDPAGFVEKTISIARKNTVVALMSGLGTALQNVTGLVPAMARVSSGRLAKEVAMFWSGKRYAFAYKHSAYMRSRAESYDRHLQEEANKLRGAHKLLPEMSTMLWFMSQTDKLTSVPVWNTAYADGMKKFANDHDKAVDYADHTVRQTQGAGRDLDVSAIMTGHPLKKIFTMFYSYFNAQLGQLVRSGAINKQLAKKNPALAVALFTKDFLLIVAIPAMLSKMIFSAPNEEDEDKPFWEKAFTSVVQYGLGMVPLVRDVGNFALQKWWPETFRPYGNNFKVSPIASAVEGVVKAPGAVYDIATGEGTTQDQKDAIMGVSYAVGLPGKLISNTWTGTQAVLDGESPTALIYGAPYKPK